ncbi:hypothetical protein GCM10022245_57120 [Streptomyces mayteni]
MPTTHAESAQQAQKQEIPRLRSKEDLTQPPTSLCGDLCDTDRRMNVKYKETARGGLAVNIIEC